MAANSSTSTYMDEYQEKMLKVFRDQGILALLEVIAEAEQHKSPAPNVSRISDDVTIDWREISTYLLCQRSEAMIEAILTNTLPSKALNELKREVRDPETAAAFSIAAGDPMIYINWLADAQGHGLSLQEYAHFLDALEVAVHLKPDTVAATRSATSATIQRGVDLERNQLAPGSRAQDLIPQGAALSNLQATARTFLKHNRQVVLPRATQQSNTEIMLRAEVGWSIGGKVRVDQHKKLTLSPLLFRVANCLLRYLFPQRGFKMHHSVVFDIVSPEDAAVGEAIASHLGALYIGYGGFNVDQGGVKLGNIYASDINWDMIKAQASQNGFLALVVSNATEIRDRLEAERKTVLVSLSGHMRFWDKRANNFDEQEDLDWHRARGEYLSATREYENKLKAWEDMQGRLKTDILQLEQKVDQLRRARLERERVNDQEANCLRQLRTIAQALGVEANENEDQGNPGA